MIAPGALRGYEEVAEWDIFNRQLWDIYNRRPHRVRGEENNGNREHALAEESHGNAKVSSPAGIAVRQVA